MIHGILNVYKEKGYTSHDVVAKLRGITGQKKIGHMGTLDPDAEGVLPVLMGRATKVCDLLPDDSKTYEAVLLLGQETDTQDSSGKVLRTGDISGLTEEEVREAVFSFAGSYEQIPPMYSARKVNGKKLYQLAREGKTVARSARTVKIDSLKILQMQLPRVKILVDCGKGTYIRTLCRDIGEKLGCGGLMESLIRTRVGPFDIAESMTLDAIEEKTKAGELESIITPIDALFLDCPKMTVRGEAERLAYHGNKLPVEMTDLPAGQVKDDNMVRLYDSNGRFLALYQHDGTEDQYRVVKMFDQRE